MNKFHFASVLTIGSLANLYAADAADVNYASSGAGTGSSGYSATLTPLSGWVPGVNGTVAGPNRSVEVDVTPIDIIENINDVIDVLDGIYIGWGEIRHQRLGVLFDVYHIDVSSSQAIDRRVISGGFDLGFRETTALFGLTYRLFESRNSHLDVLAGARLWDIDIKLGVDLNVAAGTISRGDNWTDGMIGFKGRSTLAPGWSVTGWGMIGAGGSDFTWDLYGAVTHHVRPGFDLSLGFRALSVDYESSGFTWDIIHYGPVLNTTFKF